MSEVHGVIELDNFYQVLVQRKKPNGFTTLTILRDKENISVELTEGARAALSLLLTACGAFDR